MDIIYNGKLIGESEYAHVTQKIIRFATAQKWQYTQISEPCRVLARTDDESVGDYVGPTKGLVIYPHHMSEWLRFEFDANLYMDGSMRTRYAPPQIHISVVRLFKEIRPYYQDFYLLDLFHYYENEDEVELKQCMRRTLIQIENIRRSEESSGPIRGADGSIFDYVRDDASN